MVRSAKLTMIMKKFFSLGAAALAALMLMVACTKGNKPEDVAVKFAVELSNENYDEARKLTNENGAQLIDMLKSMKDMGNMNLDAGEEEAAPVEGEEATPAEGEEAAATEEAPEAAPAEEKVKLTEQDFEVKKSEVRGDSAFVWVLNKKDQSQGELPLVLVKQGGEWKVDKIDKENK